MFPGGFNTSYNEYLKLRGYDPAASKIKILFRALIGSWFEPGFHNFWRIWNPGIGHILFRLYVWLGGKKYKALRTFLIFLICGVFHDLLVIAIFGKPFIAFTIAFSLFGLFTLLNKTVDTYLSQDQWPTVINLFVNIFLLGSSIFLAIQLQMIVFN